MAVTQQKVVAGQYFGLPGITRPREEPENNDQNVSTLAQGAQKKANITQNFSQADVIVGWLFGFEFDQTITPNGDVITESPQFPDNLIGPMSLKLQNKLKTYDVTSGVDAQLFQLIRPMRRRQRSQYTGDAPIAHSYGSQENLVSAANYSHTSTSIVRWYEIPAAIQFDEYYELDSEGKLVSAAPVDALVQAINMYGSGKLVTPQISFNQLFGNADEAPYHDSAALGTAVATCTHKFRRIGYYQPRDPQGRDAPPKFNWMYSRQADQYGLGAQKSLNIPIKFDGQVMALFYRFWDPAANGGVGAPIDISSITKLQLVYGSGMLPFDDTPEDAQLRFMQQHDNLLLPQGVLAHDLAIDERGKITNAYALNTLNTSNVKLHVEFSAPPSAEAYVIIGVEGLEFIAVQ